MKLVTGSSVWDIALVAFFALIWLLAGAEAVSAQTSVGIVYFVGGSVQVRFPSPLPMTRDFSRNTGLSLDSSPWVRTRQPV